MDSAAAVQNAVFALSVAALAAIAFIALVATARFYRSFARCKKRSAPL